MSPKPDPCPIFLSYHLLVAPSGLSDFEHRVQNAIRAHLHLEFDGMWDAFCNTPGQALYNQQRLELREEQEAVDA